MMSVRKSSEEPGEELHRALAQGKLSLSDTSLRIGAGSCLTAEWVRQFIRMNPGSIRYKLADGLLPLHTAIMCQYLSDADTDEINEIIRILVETCPDALLERVTENGSLAIHMAMSQNTMVNHETKLFMIRSCPESLRVANIEGCLPIHTACYSSYHHSIIPALVDLFPDSLMVTTENHVLPIHILSLHSGARSAHLIQMATLYPNSLKKKDADGWLPIHRACAFNRTSLIQSLVNIYPDSLGIQTTSGDLPIHISCMSKADSSFILFLANRRRESLLLRSSSGLLPVHYVCMFPQYANIVSAIVDLSPECLIERTLEGDTPLNLLSKQPLTDITCANIMYLIEKCPDSLSIHGDYGCLPLHNIVASSYAHEYMDVVRFITRLAPESVHIVNGNNSSALSIALSRRSSQFDMCRILLNSSPCLLSAESIHYDRYLFLNWLARAPTVYTISKYRGGYTIDNPRGAVISRIADDLRASRNEDPMNSTGVHKKHLGSLLFVCLSNILSYI